jgi:hypothetical protein
MSAHAALFGGRFGLDEFADGLLRRNEGVYGFTGFTANRGRIDDLVDSLREHESAWLSAIEHQVRELFPSADLGDVALHPVVGYDIGIGMRGSVCLNLNTGIFLEDHRELVSLAIHETAHIAFEQVRGPLPGIAGLGAGRDRRRFLDHYIHYEGFGVFAPSAYRSQHRLPAAGTPIQEDYRTSAETGPAASLAREYHALINNLERSDAMPLDAFFQRGFGPTRLPHRLGFALVDAICRAHGMEAVRQAVDADGTAFVEKNLPLIEAG